MFFPLSSPRIFFSTFIFVFVSFIFYVKQGQFFSGSAYRIYLLGNPIIWWSNLLFLAIFLLVFFVSAVKKQRGYENNFENNGNVTQEQREKKYERHSESESECAKVKEKKQKHSKRGWK